MNKRRIPSWAARTWAAVRPRRHLLLVAGIYVAVILLLVVFNAFTHAPTRGAACPATPTAVASPPAGGKKLATLSLREGQTTTIPFNRSEGLRSRRLEFDVTDPDLVLPTGNLAVSVGTFLRATADAELNRGLISATAEQLNRSVFLDICIDRTGEPKLGDPGTYTGVVSIVDPRVSRVDIPLTVSLSYNAWPLMVALFVLALGPATVYLWLLRGSFSRGERPAGVTLEADESSLSARLFGMWVFSRTGIMAIGAGVGAAFIAFSAGYLKNPAWGASITDLTGLFGAIFAAFVSAATALTAVRRDEPG